MAVSAVVALSAVATGMTGLTGAGDGPGLVTTLTVCLDAGSVVPVLGAAATGLTFQAARGLLTGQLCGFPLAQRRAATPPTHNDDECSQRSGDSDCNGDPPNPAIRENRRSKMDGKSTPVAAR